MTLTSRLLTHCQSWPDTYPAAFSTLPFAWTAPAPDRIPSIAAQPPLLHSSPAEPAAGRSLYAPFHQVRPAQIRGAST